MALMYVNFMIGLTPDQYEWWNSRDNRSAELRRAIDLAIKEEEKNEKGDRQ